MQQKELASLLDISPAMVSRLAKRGMPTDTLERATRWRKRHLEPGRVKGSRMGTVEAAFHPTALVASLAMGTVMTQPQALHEHDEETVEPSLPGDLSQDRINAVALAGPASLAIVELWSQATRHAQASGSETAGEMVVELRALLRRLPFGGNPCMALGVWLALTDYGMHPEAELRLATDLDTLLNPNQFAARVSPAYPNRGVHWLEDTACDWEGYGVNGWPVGWEDGLEDDD